MDLAYPYQRRKWPVLRYIYYIILLQTTYIERFCFSRRSNKSWQALQALHLGNTRERMELVEVVHRNPLLYIRKLTSPIFMSPFGSLVVFSGSKVLEQPRQLSSEVWREK